MVKLPTSPAAGHSRTAILGSATGLGIVLMLVLSAFVFSAAGAAAARGLLLDPDFGVGGEATIASEGEQSLAFGSVAPGGDLFVSGGTELWSLTGSAAGGAAFGGRPSVAFPAPPVGRFLPAALTVDGDGRVLVVGTTVLSPVKGVPIGGYGSAVVVPESVRIIRFLPDGSLDPSFGVGGVVESDLGLPPARDQDGRRLQSEPSVQATGVAVDPQGRIVVTGGADTGIAPSCQHDIFGPVAVSAAFVARLTESGSVDPEFGRGGVVGGRRLGETPLRAAAVGEPVIGGGERISYRTTDLNPCPSSRGRWGISQLGASGNVRAGFGRDGVLGGLFTALTAGSGGSVIALARVGREGGEPLIARLTRIGPNGKVDRSFGSRGHTSIKLGHSWETQVDALAIDPEGRILVGGTLGTSKGPSILVLRLSAAGRLNARTVTRVPGLVSLGPSDLFAEPDGDVVTVHLLESGGRSDLMLTRYLAGG